MSSSMYASVQEYVAMQPKLAQRRHIVRNLIRAIGFRVVGQVTASGVENIPAEGSTLLMMNHISYLDPIVCIGTVLHRFVIPMSKAENLRNPITAPIVKLWGSYPIERGEVDRKALMNSIELLKSGQLVLIAPEGTRHPEGLSRPKDGFAYIATKADSVIVPAAVSGAKDWVKRLFRTHVHVNYGRAFRFKTEGRSRIPREELSAMMDEAMYQLALAVTDETRRGVYSDVSKATSNFIEFVKN